MEEQVLDWVARKSTPAQVSNSKTLTWPSNDDFGTTVSHVEGERRLPRHDWLSLGWPIPWYPAGKGLTLDTRRKYATKNPSILKFQTVFPVHFEPPTC